MYKPHQKSENHDAEFKQVNWTFFCVVKRHLPHIVRELGKKEGFDQFLNHAVTSQLEDAAAEYLEKKGWLKYYPQRNTKEYPGGYLYYIISEWTAYWEQRIQKEREERIAYAKENNNKSVAKRRTTATGLRRQAIEKKNQGISVPQISRDLGRSREQIYRYLREQR